MNIMDFLEGQGWDVHRIAKVQYATPPEGDIRFYFKPQAVWYTKAAKHGGALRLKDARSWHLPDLRDYDGPAFLVAANRLRK